MAQTTATYAFKGGVDTNSAALATPPQALIDGLNYEPLAEGYGRVDGYERYDGRPAPSAEPYWMIPFLGGVNEFQIDDTVTGALSGATGVVLADAIVATGSFASDNAVGALPLLDVTGTFQSGEPLQVSAVTFATSTGLAVEGGASTIALDRELSSAAQELQRALILAVPGSGPVRGVALHSGTVYAWRDNVGATECLGYRATTSGWSALTQSRRIAFTAGLAAGIADGAMITGATSGATATVIRVTVSSGSFAGNNATGWIHVTGQTGTFQAAENLTISASNRATCSGNSTLNSFAQGGRYRCISHNFYGASNRFRLYGCSEVANGFEMVDHVMVPIYTGMTADTPTRVFEIGHHLGFCFVGGSIQFSSTGEPHDWAALTGAGEIGLGTEITDVVQANESAVAFFGQQKVATLTGRSIDDFQLSELTEEAGADADTAQRVARTMYLDRRGLRSLDATQAFGDFKTGTLSAQFEAYLKRKRDRGIAALGSIVSRSKSQYRIYWSDGTGIAVYMGDKVPSAIPFDLGFTASCFATGELSDGEGLFAGSSDGFVYRLDSGTSFDGIGITASCMTPFNHFGGIMQNKQFRKVTLELRGVPQATIRILAQFDYGDNAQPIDFGSQFDVRAGGTLWDVGYWDEFYWDDPVEGVAEAYIDGMGRNASFVFSSDAHPTEPAHVLQAYSVHFSPRGMKR